jgi:hypothetical protein
MKRESIQAKKETASALLSCGDRQTSNIKEAGTHRGAEERDYIKEADRGNEKAIGVVGR